MTKKRQPKWQKRLSRADLVHLQESSDGTLAAFKRNVQAQLDNPGRWPCHQCISIAHKIGIEVTR